MTTEPTEPIAEEPAQTPAPKRKSADYWVKFGFVLLVIVIAVAVYFHQREDPTLKGWNSDLNATMEKARRNNQSRVLVLITHDPMRPEDKASIDHMIQTSKMDAVFKKTGLPRVHLFYENVPKKIEEWGIKETPAYVLISPDGTVLKSRDGKKKIFYGNTTDIAFCNDFLEEEVPLKN